MFVDDIGGGSDPLDELGTVDRSLRFRPSASASLTKAFSVPGSTTKFTWSGWVKRGSLASTQLLYSVQQASATDDQIRFDAADAIAVQLNNGSATYGLVSTCVFRDPSASYHVHVEVDTTQATNTNRIKITINGQLVTAFNSATYPPQNYVLTGINTTKTHSIGKYSSGYHFDGYMSNVAFVDGQAISATSFGQFHPRTGQWRPKSKAAIRAAVAVGGGARNGWGTNGFFLTFDDITNLTTLGYDKSQSDSDTTGNNWTCNNISLTPGVAYDSMFDTPTSNHSTFNSASPFLDNATLAATYADGNLKITGAAGTTNSQSTISVNSGKWYCEMTVLGIGASNNIVFEIGVATGSYAAFYRSGGSFYGVTGTPASYTTNDVIGVEFDVDAGTVSYFKNGVQQGSTTSGLLLSGGAYNIKVQLNGASDSVVLNFGQRPFAYTPRAGFRAICTKNLPIPTNPALINPKTQFDVLTWAGSGATGAGSVSGSQFKPDLVWSKARNFAYNHLLFNSIVGGGANKALSSSTTDSEATLNDNAVSGYLSSFDANGFGFFGGSTPAYFSQSGASYAAWLWKAGGAPVANNAGSIASQVSANVDAGFSIVTYNSTGAAGTFGHGLSAVPQLVLIKARSGGNGHGIIYHSGIGNTKYIVLNQTSQALTLATMWNNTSPTSSVVTIGTDPGVNSNGSPYVAYCFAEIPGYSKIGSYTGNGSTDGPFVNCGFRPRFLMIKRVDAGPSNWTIHDSARDSGYNVSQAVLYPHLSNAEATQSALDFTSNGFKLRHSTTEQNGSGGTYIYYAIAESTFRYANAR